MSRRLTPRARAALRGRADVGADLFFETEKEAEEDEEAIDPAVARRRTKRRLTEIPPHLEIQRLPLGAAEGAKPLHWPNPKRRSDVIRRLDARLRRLDDHVQSIEEILEYGRPSAAERKKLVEDKARFESEAQGIEDRIDELEHEIEIHGDVMDDLPPRAPWGIARMRNRWK